MIFSNLHFPQCLCMDINTDELVAWEDEGLDKPQADDSSLIAVVVVVDVTVAAGVAQDVGGAGGRGWGRVASGQTYRHIQVQYDKHNAAAGTRSTILLALPPVPSILNLIYGHHGEAACQTKLEQWFGIISDFACQG